MTDNPVKINRRGSVFELVLDRPKANAIDGATSRKMGEAFVEFRDNPSYKVAIVTAAGEKFFCAGWDLKAAAEGEEPTTDYGEGGWAGIQELPNLNKPVIAAINGICCGGGLEWALSCDIIIAAEHASFALPEIKSGIIADAATIKLPKRIPYHIAMELLFTRITTMSIRLRSVSCKEIAFVTWSSSSSSLFGGSSVLAAPLPPAFAAMSELLFSSTGCEPFFFGPLPPKTVPEASVFQTI